MGIAPVNATTGGPLPAAATLTLLTVEDLTAQFKVRKRKVYQLVRDEGLPHLRMGRFLRFNPAQVTRWLSTQSEIVPRPGGRR